MTIQWRFSFCTVALLGIFVAGCGGGLGAPKVEPVVETVEPGNMGNPTPDGTATSTEESGPGASGGGGGAGGPGSNP